MALEKGYLVKKQSNSVTNKMVKHDVDPRCDFAGVQYLLSVKCSPVNKAVVWIISV